MAEEEEQEENVEEASIRNEFPAGRVKKIMRLDKEINKVTSEALFLVSRSTELFLLFLAEKSAEVATEKKRKIVKSEHIRVAVKRHRPTSDFLSDSLSAPTPQPQEEARHKARPREVADKQPPAGTRRIDDFFAKSTSGASTSVCESPVNS